MIKKTLDNGLTIILDDRKTESVAVSVTMKVGAINEEDRNRGISHFMEHMVFEGTKNRSALQIANEIESLGGTIGAYTSSERTVFYIKILAKHVDVAIDILYDVVANPTFEQPIIDKERTVVLSEIEMKRDEPRFYQWQVFQKALYTVFTGRHPVIGYKGIVEKMTREDFLEYYSKQYVPENMIVTVAGDTSGALTAIEKRFSTIEGKKAPALKVTREPIRETRKITKEKMPIKQTYMVIGYIAPDRNSRDSYVFDVIQAILGRGISGRLFDEIRTKRGLGYDVGCHYSDNKHYGFIAAYVTADGSKMSIAKKIILEQFQKIDDLTPTELSDAKNYIEGEFALHNEDTMNRADNLGFFEYVGNTDLYTDYIKNIKKVTVADIKRVKNRYLNPETYTQIVLEEQR